MSKKDISRKKVKKLEKQAVYGSSKERASAQKKLKALRKNEREKLAKAKKRQKKAQKHAAELTLNDALASLGKLHCTCCKKHCPLTHPRCGKGKKLRSKAMARASRVA